MATLLITKDILESMVFGRCENHVNVLEVRDCGQTLEIDISGADVPDCEKVIAIVNCQQNRAGQKFERITFEKI